MRAREGIGACGEIETPSKDLSREGLLDRPNLLDAHERATPFLLVLGERELSRGLLSLRAGSEQRVLPSAEAVLELSSALAAPL